MGVTDALAHARPYTYADLEAMPADGRRYELIDGTLIVTPAPRISDQIAVLELAVVLRSAASAEFQVLVGPCDYLVSNLTVLQPDVLVVNAADLGEKNVKQPPALVVEVLSPSTGRVDLETKRLAYEAAGVPSYWLVDPGEPLLTVLELREGASTEVARVSGDEAWEGSAPFPVRVVPAELIR